jgi:hypothetical protein
MLERYSSDLSSPSGDIPRAGNIVFIMGSILDDEILKLVFE